MNNNGTLITHHGLYWLTALMLSTQLPHVLNLPIWISLSGIALVLLKLRLHRNSEDRRWLRTPLLAALAIGAALLLKLQYGYLLGRDPCVALLYFLMALKFAETHRRRDVTLLICLSGFLLFTQYFYSQSPLAALFTMPALIAMGGSLYVLRDHAEYPGTRAVIALIGKLLLQGVPLAAVLFVLFPRLSGPLWTLPADVGSGVTGLSDRLTPGLVSDLSRSGEVAFRVEFEGEVPDPSELYWRGPVFENFDGQQWYGEPSADKVEVAAVPARGPLSHYTVMLEAHQQRWLFALDQAISLPYQAQDRLQSRPLAQLTGNRQLLSSKPIDSALRYRVSSALSGRFGDEQVNLALNLATGERNPKTRVFAQQLRAEHGDDRRVVAAALAHFREQPFHYTLRPDLLGDAPVDEFLFRTRRGFCEHYASAFTYLMRAAGIPARIVTGYQGGELNGDYLIVRQANAHAWSEVWLDDHWQRVDPTAAVAPSRIELGPEAALAEDEPLPSAMRPTADWLHSLRLGADALNYRWRRYIVDFGADRQRSLFENLGFPSPQPWQILSVIFTVAGLWALTILKLPMLTLHRRHDAAAVWARYISRLKSTGLPLQITHGPQEVCNMACAVWPQYADHFVAISSAYVRARYAPTSAVPAERKRAERALREHLHALPRAFTLRRSHPARDSRSQLLLRFQHWFQV